MSILEKTEPFVKDTNKYRVLSMTLESLFHEYAYIKCLYNGGNNKYQKQSCKITIGKCPS